MKITNPFTQRTYELNPQQMVPETDKEKDEELDLALQEWEERTKLLPFTAAGQFTDAEGNIYNMSARYADDATKVFPTVQVTVTDAAGNVTDYHIDITKIDTTHATDIEMFALCSHADTRRGETGSEDIPDGTLSTWESVNHYRKLAIEAGYQDSAIGEKPGEIQKNWRDMMSAISQDYKENELYDAYLHADRMKDMLEYYSHFDNYEDRPAFFNPFCAIRDYVFIGIINLDYGITIETSSKGTISCMDYSTPPGVPAETLWVRELTPEEMERGDQLGYSKYHPYQPDYTKYRPFLYEYSFWDGYIKGEIDLDEYDTYIKEIKHQYAGGNMFKNCPGSVKQAWNQAEKQMKFQGLGMDEKHSAPRFVSEYMNEMMDAMKQGKSPNVLGDTVESAVAFAKRAIERLDNMDFENTTESYRRLKLQEKGFYYDFLGYLEPTKAHSPLDRLLQQMGRV